MTPISIIVNGSFCPGGDWSADSIARHNYVWKGTTRRSYFSITFDKFIAFVAKFKLKKKYFVKKNFKNFLYIYLIRTRVCSFFQRRTTSKGKFQSFVPWTNGNCPRFASVYKRSIVTRDRISKKKFSKKSRGSGSFPVEVRIPPATRGYTWKA